MESKQPRKLLGAKAQRVGSVVIRHFDVAPLVGLQGSSPDSGLPNTLPLNHLESEAAGIAASFWIVLPMLRRLVLKTRAPERDEGWIP